MAPDITKRQARRARLAAAALAALLVAAGHALWPDPERRTECLVQGVLVLGYGHLLGAAAGPRRARPTAPFARRALAAGFTGTGLASLFVVHQLLLEVAFLPLLAVSLWHSVENDRALARPRAHAVPLGPLPRGPGHHLRVAGLTAALLLAVATTLGPAERAGLAGGALPLPDLSAHLRFADAFAAATAYHLFQWLAVLAQRAAAETGPQARRRRRSLARRLLVTHAPPATLAALAADAPPGPLAALHALAFDPGLYLFVSALHVAHTAAGRGLEPRAGQASAMRSGAASLR